MVIKSTRTWFILQIIVAAMLAGCNQAPPPEVTVQAALPTPTLEPTFTRILEPAVTTFPEIPQIGLGTAERRITPSSTETEAGEEALSTITDVEDELPARGVPQPTERSGQTPQVILVLDVSRSMGSLVLPQNLPAELAEFRAQIEQIETDPEYLRLSQELSAILSDSRVEAAFQEWTEASTALDSWLSKNGYGENQFAIADQVASLLAEYQCNVTYDAFIAYSVGSLSDLDEKINTACPAITLSETQRQAIKDVVAYVEQPEYQAIRASETELFEAYVEVRDALNYQEVREQFRALQNNRDYNQLQAEFEQAAAAQGIPSRLDLAKLAALTLMDLSRLDELASGQESPLGVVDFSNGANLLQPLTINFSQVEARINELQPLYETNIAAGLNTALTELAQYQDRDQPAAIILLSDGHNNQGTPAEQILTQVPVRARELGVNICTIGLGNDEADVEVGLLQNLAEATEGQYTFAATAQELVSFFVACRQGLISPLVDQFAGVAKQGEKVEVGQIDIREDAGELTLTFNYLQGRLSIELVDSEGSLIDETYPGVQIEQGETVQLVKVTNPRPGEWTVRVTANEAPQDGVLYNVIVTVDLAAPTPTPTPTPLPTPTAVSVAEAPSSNATPVPEGGSSGIGASASVSAPTPSPEDSSSFLDHAGGYLAGGGVLLGLMLGVGGIILVFSYLKRSRKV